MDGKNANLPDSRNGFVFLCCFLIVADGASNIL